MVGSVEERAFEEGAFGVRRDEVWDSVVLELYDTHRDSWSGFAPAQSPATCAHIFDNQS